MYRMASVAILSLMIGIVVGAVGLRLLREEMELQLGEGSRLKPTYLFRLTAEDAENLIVRLAMLPGAGTNGGELIGNTEIGYAVSDAKSCEDSGELAEILGEILQNNQYQCVMMSWKAN